MEDKTILITGSTDGIGRQTALELAKMGAKILIHGRDEGRGKSAASEITAESGNRRVEIVMADLSSLEQVRKLADQIKHKHEHLDVLINNAGIFEKSYRESEDGFEKTFAVNHLAPFLLTLLLLRTIKNSPQGRIINVSSIAHFRSPEIDFSDLNLTERVAPATQKPLRGSPKKGHRKKVSFFYQLLHSINKKNYSGYGAYSHSKLCNIFFTYELAERLKGTRVTANCLHPGVIGTKLLRASFGMVGAPLSEGAQTSVYLATAPGLEKVSGKYFSDKEEHESSPYSYDIGVRKKLWEASLQLTGLV